MESFELEKIIAATGISSALAGLYGACQHFGVDFVSWQTSWAGRPFSTFGNPNFASGWWLMVLPLFLARGCGQKTRYRPFWLLVCALAALNLYWGKTRGAWIACGISFVLGAVHFLSQKYKSSFLQRLAYALPLTLLLGSLSSLWFGSSLFKSSNDTSIQERIFKWETAKKIWKENPFFGVGAGNLKTHFAWHQAEIQEKMKFSLKSTSETNVHNEYLQILAEVGITGLLSFLAVWLCWHWKLGRNGPAGIYMALWSLLFYSLTNFPFRIAPNACLAFFLLGISEPRLNRSEEKLPPISNKKLKIAAAGVFMIPGASLFYFLIFPQLIADYHRKKAAESEKTGRLQEAISRYEKAIELDTPHSERAAYKLGECLRQTGDLQKAISAYKISVHLRNYGEVYNDIGNCYYLLQNWSEAAKHWKIAVQLGMPDREVLAQTKENLKIINEEELK